MGEALWQVFREKRKTRIGIPQKGLRKKHGK